MRFASFSDAHTWSGTWRQYLTRSNVPDLKNFTDLVTVVGPSESRSANSQENATQPQKTHFQILKRKSQSIKKKKKKRNPVKAPLPPGPQSGSGDSTFQDFINRRGSFRSLSCSSSSNPSADSSFSRAAGLSESCMLSGFVGPNRGGTERYLNTDAAQRHRPLVASRMNYVTNG